jgi:hypothetical protein
MQKKDGQVAHTAVLPGVDVERAASLATGDARRIKKRARGHLPCPETCLQLAGFFGELVGDIVIVSAKVKPVQREQIYNIALEVHPAVISHAPHSERSSDVLGAAAWARFGGYCVDADVTAEGCVSRARHGVLL